MIEINNLVKGYGNLVALDHLNLNIHEGEIFGLLGPNGSGKTTFIKLLMRLYDPQKGEILIDGVSIKEYSLKSIYKNIGVIFQDFIKYPLTAR